MKIVLIILIFCFYFLVESNAQSDTLIINLKNGTDEKIAVSQIQKIQFENITSVNEPRTDYTNLQLSGNYPNPFAEQTNIEFEIPVSGSVEVVIYDINGKIINILKCENCTGGKNSLLWDCIDNNKNRVPSGVYYYEVRYNNDIQSKKMILIK